MKILIVSYFFEPEITPRAYRTAELAKALVRRGHEVTVVLPNKTVFRENPVENEGVRILYADGPQVSGGAGKVSGSARRAMPGWLVRTILYFYNHEFFAKYDKGIYRRLAGIEGHYDLLLSVSYPVAIHRAVIKALGKNPGLTAEVKLAEFSDPPMRGEYNKSYFPPYGCFLKKAGKFFDRFVIPVENALPVYLKYKPAGEISVIPQGFDNSGIEVRPYREHDRPTFAFAGRFYRNTRDPEPLLRYLADSGRDFHFLLYLIDRDPYFDGMIDRYNSISKGTIEVCPPLPRNELIGELSTMDFLVNHNFTYRTATPSKLIDYSLAGRPVFSFGSDNFDAAVFGKFLDGDYTSATPLPDPSYYDIDQIAASFEAIANAR